MLINSQPKRNKVNLILSNSGEKVSYLKTNGSDMTDRI